ncbi:MAG: alanine racemase [Elusimicrobia bacterium]|nr:alanine racemase [Elusimicrobiota bacterium]MDE2237539.1 alanine racemase [Elusimicrobiota bacterium]MDE2424565.1 alanine racemase [Elusimicrobiota bacterium]
MSPRAATVRRFFRPTWAEIDLSLLRDNLTRLRARVGRGVKLMFVVKANAYGHGSAACAKTAEQGGLADWLGVSSVEEGVALREAGLKLPILVLGSLYPFESFLAAADYGLTPTVASSESAKRLLEAARTLRRRVSCHLKVETGMGRIGVSPPAALAAARLLKSESLVRVQGVYTHLSCADGDAAFTRRQLRVFGLALEGLRRLGISPLLRHAANSAAALRYPRARFDMVRPGLALYGLWPGFSPILSLKTKLVFLKTVARGTPISYGAAFRAKRRTRVATLAIGYADGWSRANSDNGCVLVRGRRCPIIGRVTMDMTMIDVTAVDGSRVGDEAVLIGEQGRERVSAGEVARRLATIPYEVTTAISARVPRVYLP